MKRRDFLKKSGIALGAAGLTTFPHVWVKDYQFAWADDDENWFNPTRRYCGHLSLFAQIAAAAGPDLTPETFEQAAYTLTDFVLPGAPSNSLSPSKLGARDLYRLTTFDPDVGNGENVPLTDLIDIVP